MNVWLVKLEEPLPIDDSYRPYRMGMLANALVNRGHRVVWWTTDLHHLTGTSRFGEDTTVTVHSNLNLELISSGIKYRSAVSMARLLSNYLIARKFKAMASQREKPDVIVCAMPTPDLARASSYLGHQFGVPVIIDARDFWPDIFEYELTGYKKLMSSPVRWLMKKDLSYAARKASSLVGITEFFRDHLIRYSGGIQDANMNAVFPLGYDPTINLLSRADEVKADLFWGRILGDDWRNAKVKYVYFAGRFNRTMFQEIEPVVELISRSRHELPDYRFVFCGTGQYEDEIRSAIAPYSNVVLPGEISPLNLSMLRRHSYLALQPIYNRIDYMNSLSNKFFEYISSGLPIVTSLRGLTGSTIEKENIGYVYTDSDSLVDSMKKLYFDENKRMQLSENGKILFENRFSSEVIYADFAKHCEKISVYGKDV